MCTIRLFHIVAALVVVFICTNNVAQGKLDAAGKAQKTNILNNANGVLKHGAPADINKLEKAAAACVAKNDPANIRMVLLRVIHLLGKFNRQKVGKPKRSAFNDDNDEEEDFEERGIKEDNAKLLDTVSKYTHLLSPAEHKQYDAAVKKFSSASPQQQQVYIRHLTKYVQQCAAGMKVVLKHNKKTKREELDDYLEDGDDEY
jgi:hypothetical protein